MTLREQIETDASEVFLQTDDFAEACTYVSKSGGPRSITCNVEESSRLEVEGHGRFLVTVLNVYCLRDSSTGIDDPQIGDVLTLARLPAEKAFTFVGIGEDADEYAWWLTFERRAPYSRGGGR